MMSVINWLDHLDKMIFLLVQHDSDHAWLDSFMVVLRNPYTWLPLYLVLLVWSIWKGKRKAWIFILLSLLTFAVTDSVTAQILKPMFGRLRPCYDPEIHSLMRSLVDCGGLYSMPSNHAANHFGLAAFWYAAVKTMNGKKWSWTWLWAGVIGYAQVYVGKHYPFDILVGALMGILTGIGMALLFGLWWNRERRGTYGLSLTQLTHADRSI